MTQVIQRDFADIRWNYWILENSCDQCLKKVNFNLLSCYTEFHKGDIKVRKRPWIL